MSKKDNRLNPYDLTGQFRILLKGGQLFAGEVKGAWENALLVADMNNGDSIIFMDTIAVMMEGIEPPSTEEQQPIDEQKGGA